MTACCVEVLLPGVARRRQRPRRRPRPGQGLSSTAGDVTTGGAGGPGGEHVLPVTYVAQPAAQSSDVDCGTPLSRPGTKVFEESPPTSAEPRKSPTSARYLACWSAWWCLAVPADADPTGPGVTAMHADVGHVKHRPEARQRRSVLEDGGKIDATFPRETERLFDCSRQDYMFI